MRFGKVAENANIPSQKHLAKAAGISKHELSQINQDHLMPTRDKLRRLCEAAGCVPTDVYAPEEMDLAGCMGQTQEAPVKSKDQRSAKYKQLSIRVPRNVAATIPDDLWETLGWDSFQALGMDMLKAALEKYWEIKSAAPAATSTGGKQDG